MVPAAAGGEGQEPEGRVAAGCSVPGPGGGHVRQQLTGIGRSRWRLSLRKVGNVPIYHVDGSYFMFLCWLELCFHFFFLFGQAGCGSG